MIQLHCISSSIIACPVRFIGSSLFSQNSPIFPRRIAFVTGTLGCCSFSRERKNSERRRRRRGMIVCGGFLPVDPWATSIDSQSVASQLFAVSLFPYLGFLYFITKSKSAPKLTLFGFYFLLAFVGATIPAGIYARVNYGTSLANVDWLHGGAESLLTLTNLFIVLGLRRALRESSSKSEQSKTDDVSGIQEQEKSSM